MDLYEFPISAYRLYRLRAPVLTSEEKSGLGTASAKRSFASKIVPVPDLHFPEITLVLPRDHRLPRALLLLDFRLPKIGSNAHPLLSCNLIVDD